MKLGFKRWFAKRRTGTAPPYRTNCPPGTATVPDKLSPRYDNRTGQTVPPVRPGTVKWTHTYETISIADEHFAVPVGDCGNYHQLVCMNGTGRLLFDLLGQDFTEKEIAERMSEKFDISPETAAKDVGQGIRLLKESGAIMP